MKKLLLSLALAAIVFPAALFADHLDGGFHSYADGRFSITDLAHKHQQVTFTHHDKIAFVDEAGAAFDHHTLKPGHPVTVHYSGEGEHRIVSKVIVHKHHHD